MRKIPFFLSALCTIGLVFLLNARLVIKGSKTPRMGFFFSPQQGFWANAEALDAQFNADIQSPLLQGKVEVYLDERLVPHVYAEKENDVYFAQGYLHAKFRLWQMEFQTHAAGGRLSEIMGAESGGTNFLNVDKFFRRLGMVYGAENSLKEMEKDTLIKSCADAYTAGVNAYISEMRKSDLPLEYKLLDYQPEPWTNMKTALFLKYMSFDLAGFEEDFEMTNAKQVFTKEQFEILFPYGQDSLDPIMPKGTIFQQAGLVITPPKNADSAYLQFKLPVLVADTTIKPDPLNGSNNWAVAGSKTASGRPILCNDPHLSLNLPSLWFEMQLQTPNFNAYGATFPGSPCVIIGFNEHAAFGFTNAMRDVRDYFEIQFKDTTMQEYWYDSAWTKTTIREEVIKIKGQPDNVEKIAMTVFGPVMYDKNYKDKLGTGKYWACKWLAHEGSNELRTFNKLDHAKTYADYEDAISTFKCPGQNMIFANTNGDIAIRQQGKFPAKWLRQGDFLMDGTSAAYDWQGYIEDSLNITMHNPERGFVSSANQYPYDVKTYPYYLGGGYALERGNFINKQLTAMQGITPKDMQALQNNNYDLFAQWAAPSLLKYIDETKLNEDEKKYVTLLRNWNYYDNADEKGASVFSAWFDSLKVYMYQDELAQSDKPFPSIDRTTLMESLRKDSNYVFADDIRTSQKETIADMVLLAFRKAYPTWEKADKEDKLAWGYYKNASVNHLLKIPALSTKNLYSNGSWSCINAYKTTHGPSWKMVVHLTDGIEAYGIYPGGQSGNVGSQFYDNSVKDWSIGKYYTLHLYTPAQAAAFNNRRGKITFSKS